METSRNGFELESKLDIKCHYMTDNQLVAAMLPLNALRRLKHDAIEIGLKNDKD